MANPPTNNVLIVDANGNPVGVTAGALNTSGGGGGGGAATIADGADVAQGSTADAASASTVVGLLKNLKAALAGTLASNIAQINGVTPLMGAGITGTGSPRVTPVTAATGAAPTAFTATASTQVFASNAARRMFTVYNNSNVDLYLMLASAAVSVTSYHVKVPASGGYFSTTDYSGEIRGILSAAIGTGQVNPGEFT